MLQLNMPETEEQNSAAPAPAASGESLADIAASFAESQPSAKPADKSDAKANIKAEAKQEPKQDPAGGETAAEKCPDCGSTVKVCGEVDGKPATFCPACEAEHRYTVAMPAGEADWSAAELEIATLAVLRARTERYAAGLKSRLAEAEGEAANAAGALDAAVERYRGTPVEINDGEVVALEPADGGVETLRYSPIVDPVKAAAPSADADYQSVLSAAKLSDLKLVRDSKPVSLKGSVEKLAEAGVETIWAWEQLRKDVATGKAEYPKRLRKDDLEDAVTAWIAANWSGETAAAAPVAAPVAEQPAAAAPAEEPEPPAVATVAAGPVEQAEPVNLSLDDL